MKQFIINNPFAAVAAAFVLGMIVMCLLCKLFCPCGKKNGAKCQAKAKDQKKGGEEKPFEKRKPHPAPADGSIEIYAGNLSYEMTEEQLRAEFEAFGKVNNVKMVTYPNGKHKGYGFVHMPNADEVNAACAALDGKEILGRKIKCNIARNTI